MGRQEPFQTENDLPETWAYTEGNLFSQETLTTQEILAFLEGKLDVKFPDLAYFNKWRQRLEGTGRWFGFNWPALFFTFAWAFARKLYAAGFLFLASVYVVQFLVALISQSQAAAIVSGILVRLAFPFLVNRYLFSRMVKVVSEVRLTTDDIDSRLKEIASRGGLSTSGFVLGLLINLALTALFFIGQLAL